MLRIEIVYAQPERSIFKLVALPRGAMIGDALKLAAADPDFLGIDLDGSAVGIFGKVAQRDQPLQDGDRIEIYRPLAEEPKFARRKRASRDSRAGARSGVDVKANKSGRS